jgi:cytochrome b561
MDDLPRGPEKLERVALHASLGLSLLALVVLRCLWRLANGFPNPAGDHKWWEVKAARAVHLALLGLIFLLPIAGWTSLAAGGQEVSFLGLAALPEVIPRSETLEEVAEGVHEFAANFLMLLVLLHVAAALKHQLVDRDGTLRRMIVPKSE